jgi:hypothetical protein
MLVDSPVVAFGDGVSLSEFFRWECCNERRLIESDLVFPPAKLEKSVSPLSFGLSLEVTILSISAGWGCSSAPVCCKSMSNIAQMFTPESAKSVSNRDH